MLKLFSACAFAGLGVALMSAGGAGSGPSAPPDELKAGDRAPEFALPGSDGRVHRLADYKGRTVVVAWFPKAFTGG